MKEKKAKGFYLSMAGAVISLLCVFVYGMVMYRMTPVYLMLAAAVVLGIIGFLLYGKFGNRAVFALLPIINAALMASAAVWGVSLMVNQIGYVISGLDGMDTIMGLIYFEIAAVISMLLNIVASFLPMAKEAE